MKIENHTWTPHLIIVIMIIIITHLNMDLCGQRKNLLHLIFSYERCLQQPDHMSFNHTFTVATCSKQQLSDRLMNIIHLTFMTTITNYG